MKDGNGTERAPTGQCLRLLVAFERCKRISDLRHRWGLPIVAKTQRPFQTVYVIPRGHRREARRLIRAGERASQ